MSGGWFGAWAGDTAGKWWGRVAAELPPEESAGSTSSSMGGNGLSRANRRRGVVFGGTVGGTTRELDSSIVPFGDAGGEAGFEAPRDPRRPLDQAGIDELLARLDREDREQATRDEPPVQTPVSTGEGINQLEEIAARSAAIDADPAHLVARGESPEARDARAKAEQQKLMMVFLLAEEFISE